VLECVLLDIAAEQGAEGMHVATIEKQKSEELCPQRVCSACRSAGASTPGSRCGRPGAPRRPIVWGQLKTPSPSSSSFFAAGEVGRKKEQKHEIKEVFGLLDADGSGEVDSEEMQVTMRVLGSEPKKKQTKKMISDVDGDGSGIIGCEECLKMMTFKILNRDPEDEILKALLSLRRRRDEQDLRQEFEARLHRGVWRGHRAADRGQAEDGHEYAEPSSVVGLVGGPSSATGSAMGLQFGRVVVEDVDAKAKKPCKGQEARGEEVAESHEDDEDPS